MDAIVVDEEPIAGDKRPSTLIVLALLMGVALVFSWLGAYAFTNALRAAELVQPWEGADPRPRWMLFAFTALMGVFGLCALIFRQSSARQLRRIDEMEAATESETP